jgi:uncharacterized delta-60 repeat protein
MKTKNILLVVIIFSAIASGFVSGEAFTQVYQQWSKTMNGSINNEDVFRCVTNDDSGNVYAVGTVYNATTGRDIAVRKYNPAGDLQWEHVYSSSAPDGQDGGTEVMYKNNFLYILGDARNAANTSSDIILMKRNAATGALIWSAAFNSSGNSADHSYSMAIDNAENIYVVGMSDFQNVSFEMLVVKFNASGGQQWAHTIGGPGFDRATDVAVDNSGNIYVCGRDEASNYVSHMVTMKYQPDGTQQMYEIVQNGVDSSDGAVKIAVDAQGNIYTAGYVTSSNQQLNGALVKYNQAGAQQWVRYYNGASNGDDYINDMKLDAAGNIYMTGTSFNTPTQNDYITLKYNSAGTKLWEARYIGNYLNGNNSAYSLGLDAAGNVYVTGASFETTAGTDIVTVKYSSTGSLQWAMKNNGSVNTGFNEAGYSVAVDNINNVFVAGKNDADDGIIIKYVQAPIGIQQNGNEVPAEFELGQNYPNPFNPVTNIEFSVPRSSFVRLAVFDILGREVSVLVNRHLDAGKYKYDFDASKLSSGIFFYRLEADNFSEVKKMNLIK